MYKNAKTNSVHLLKNMPFKKNVPEQASIDVLSSAVKVIAVELRPFVALNGVGMLQSAETLISIGAKFDETDVKVVEPGRHKIAAHV